ncbi:hypothetical protein RHO12_02965 [Orbus sturtevantii]|uniref:hypothetical protein n=1 Tax=Orbus sturtevantii TaxID=3074109 RepID=UPI00370D8085
MDKFINSDFSNYSALEKEYFIFYISCFDHFLSEDEYINVDLVCYADVGKDPNKMKQFVQIKNKFIVFYKLLFKLAKGDVIVMLDNIPILIKSFDEYQRHVNNALLESPLCTLLYPTLGCFTRTGYDLTHEFFVLKPKLLNEQKINKSIKKIGLNMFKK